MSETKVTTRKEAHAEAVAFLKSAAEAIDQAHTSLRDAKTFECCAIKAPAGLGSMWMNTADAFRIVDGLYREAIAARCDECGAAIAACECSWSNEAVS